MMARVMWVKDMHWWAYFLWCFNSFLCICCTASVASERLEISFTGMQMCLFPLLPNVTMLESYEVSNPFDDGSGYSTNERVLAFLNVVG